jgi:hypothetical protein
MNEINKEIVIDGKTSWIEKTAQEIVSRNTRTVTIQFHESFDKWVSFSVEIIKDLLLTHKDKNILIVGRDKLSSIAMKQKFCHAFGLYLVQNQIVDELVFRNVKFTSHDEIKDSNADCVFIYSVLGIPNDVLHDLAFSNDSMVKKTILCKIIPDAKEDNEENNIWSIIHSEHNFENACYKVVGDSNRKVFGIAEDPIEYAIKKYGDSPVIEILKEMDRARRQYNSGDKTPPTALEVLLEAMRKFS